MPGAAGSGGSSRSRPGRRREDAVFRHGRQDGSEGGDGIVPARRDRGVTGEFGDGGPVVLTRHRPGGQAVAVKQLVLAAHQVVLAVSPGRLGVGAVAGPGRRGREKDARPVQSAADDRLASLNSPGTDASSRSSQIGPRPPRVHRRVGEEGAPDAQGHSPWGSNRGVRVGLAQFAYRSVLVCRAARRQA